MRLKSYFSDSVHGAMEKARLELGPDAMLISSRQTGIDLKDLGAYEVVFGIAPSSDSASSARSEPDRETPADPNERVLRELSELRRQMDSFAQSVARATLNRATEQFTPELTRIYDRLLQASFSRELAHELIESISLQFRNEENAALRIQRDPFARDLLMALLDAEIASRLHVNASLGENTSHDSKPVLLVGPPGSGKTTSIVKLGLEYGLKRKRPLHLLSLDTLRLGGCDQLSRYAQIAGVDFRAIYEYPMLPVALSQSSAKGLTLIDTSGYANAEEADLDQLAEVVGSLDLDVHLVIPAHLSLPAADRICQLFSNLNPAKLLLTHMDSVVGPAVPIELSLRSGLPLSFFGTGQQIPEDIRPAEKTSLIAQLTPRERAASVAA